ncbi:MAG: DNA mismatch endonuclease Vsr [Methylococcales bacterium]
MVDKISKEHRSWNMSRIKSANTKPEIIVRKILHRIGFRFRLNGRVSKKYNSKGVLPGKPDIVLAGYKAVVFVNGCFWHRHKGCKDATIPKTRTEWWLEKLNKNVERDINKRIELENDGWKVIVIWECETVLTNIVNLENKLKIKI